MQTQPQKSGLAVFDVEGVLIPKKRYLFFDVGRTLGFRRFVTIILWGFLYELGLISLKSALRHVFKAFKGVHVAKLVRIFKRMPTMPGAEGLFEGLRKDGWKTALISSGLPTVIVQDLASTLEADYAVGFELEQEGGALTGRIMGDVIERNGKLPALAEILEKEDMSPRDCVVVADDRNNASILLPEAMKVGYNPDFIVRMKADAIVDGELPEILAVIKGETKRTRKLPNRSDMARESIHASGFFMPVIAGFVGLHAVALFIFVMTLLYIVSEMARMGGRDLPMISNLTRVAATQPELYEFATAPVFFALGILLTLLIFPQPISSGAIAIFALGDSTASLFGKALGRTQLALNRGKTLEGSIFGFLFAFLAGSCFVSMPLALAGAAVAMVVEYLPLPLNDNLLIPLITALALTIVPLTLAT